MYDCVTVQLKCLFIAMVIPIIFISSLLMTKWQAELRKESQLLLALQPFLVYITHTHTHTQFCLLVQGYPTTQFKEVKWHLVRVVPRHHHSEAGRAAADRQTQWNLSHPCQREQIWLLPVFQVRQVFSVKWQYCSCTGWIASFPGSFRMGMPGVATHRTKFIWEPKIAHCVLL